ncbi:hypothetical protein QE382_002272 [Sphingobacterium zeae]|uniref:PoNi C-terminal domain-containing protein n=1 Tax=Sphingobacterium zeae TaxID=1776859 RepID=A0ABU0U5S2_9SPHI|nr:PoNe immunity protein domain-containing protein [Sphingobacterium zeae]MDQ1150288.1 hypothetical protein [Sphingobacterium zeae]
MYLNKTWYKKMKLTYWFDNDKNDVFFAYWSFEIAAIVKILGVNNTLLKNSENAIGVGIEAIS